ncbi:CBS domain-containing protein [Clostridium fallax]|uniref:CBS domain-containing protein n=1 Tax=Clostridium fallax TaxID=1533 RepID=A0A1M4VDG7_9CLOT|nr:CBS domain-containing protein [Clostridium fallax]SHE66880.1 CBS domain-containing protein [Clostridium fallax]SQB05774.1 CBS domain-containing protein [Clostridium fallax]
MLVKTIMLPKDKLTTVTSEASIGKALEIMDKHKFLSIPVVDGNLFRGSISKNVIYQFYFEKCNDKKSLLEDYTVEHLLRKDMPVINLREEVEKAVAFLEKMNISFVAVIDEYDNFQGILTHNAVFHQFNNLFGLNKGERLAVTAFDVPGQISRLSKILTENQSDIISFVVVDPQSFTDVKEIVVRMKTNKLEEIKKKLKDAGFKIV